MVKFDIFGYELVYCICTCHCSQDFRAHVKIASRIVFYRMYRVAQNKIPHRRVFNISATSGLILKIVEAA